MVTFIEEEMLRAGDGSGSTALRLLQKTSSIPAPTWLGSMGSDALIQPLSAAACTWCTYMKVKYSKTHKIHRKNVKENNGQVFKTLDSTINS